LICVGNGEHFELLNKIDGIKLYPFCSERKLIEISKAASVFILPSRNDQWGVVVQEFSCLGKALLLSENVGARSTFFINKYNGLMFKNNCAEDLAKKMFEFSEMNDVDLLKIQKNSRALSLKMTPESSAANFLSIIL